MTINTKSLKQLVLKSFKITLQNIKTSRINDNKEKSRKWLECLFTNLEAHYSCCNISRVLMQHIGKKSSLLKTGEFLYDIHVVNIIQQHAYSQRNTVEYISLSELVIESEFTKNAKGVINDFSKLICSNAKAKLFICSQHIQQKILLEYPANYCSGHLYLLLLPYPEEWPNNNKVEFYKYNRKKGKWVPR